MNTKQLREQIVGTKYTLNLDEIKGVDPELYDILTEEDGFTEGTFKIEFNYDKVIYYLKDQDTLNFIGEDYLQDVDDHILDKYLTLIKK